MKEEESDVEYYATLNKNKPSQKKQITQHIAHLISHILNITFKNSLPFKPGFFISC
jgi:hypothetical protein